MSKVVVTFGSFDCFHYVHYFILKRASMFGDIIKVGLSSDAFHFSKKNREAVCPFDVRKQIIEDFNFIDSVFSEDCMEKKRQYLIKHEADVLVMGDDWLGKFDEFLDICEVVYLPRTEAISTSIILAS